MSKDDALRLALNALKGGTYEQKLAACAAIQKALQTPEETQVPAVALRRPRMYAVVMADGRISKLRGNFESAEKCKDKFNAKYANTHGPATVRAITRLE